MPPQPSWFEQLDEIIAHLETLRCPVVDRRVVETEFRLSRRGAIHLMNRFGATQIAGNVLLLDRLELLRRLKAIRKTPEVVWERQRRRRLAEILEQARRSSAGRRVRIQVTPPPDGRGLPSGVRLGGGLVEIRYAGPEDLLSKLYALAQLAAADYQAFCELAASPPQ